MKPEKINENEMVALNNEEIAEVNGGMQQDDITLYTSSGPGYHMGKSPEKSVQEKSDDRA